MGIVSLLLKTLLLLEGRTKQVQWEATKTNATMRATGNWMIGTAHNSANRILLSFLSGLQLMLISKLGMSKRQLVAYVS